MKRSIFSLLGLLLVLSACTKDPMGYLEYYANTFAYNVMHTYYLWKDEPEVASEISSWKNSGDAIQKVDACRYEADKWTKLYSDYSAFESSITGSGKTFGLDFGAYYMDSQRTQVEAIVRFTYADSPARKAGLKRGDEIVMIDGEKMTPQNYRTVLNKFYTATFITLGLADGRSVVLNAVEMYENPVHTVRTFEHNGEPMGYLHFTNFTLDACKDLESAFAQFKADGIRELVLDLRYNGGGYVTTATALASMIAQTSAVSQKKVYNLEIYNDILADQEKDKTCFSPEITYTSPVTGQKVTVKPLDVNPGVEHLWVLVTDQSASASEAIICGLIPYMDVTLVGEQTYGKFCGGILIKAVDWFRAVEKKQGLKNFDYDDACTTLATWGQYVITSRYADCNGRTLSMPDGIPVDMAGDDRPLDGFELGDPAETLLATALGAVKSAPAGTALQPVEQPLRRPGFGVLLH